MANLTQLHEQLVFSLGTLAAGSATVANSKIDASRRQGFRLIKSEYTIEVKGKTTNEGPLQIGVGFNLTAVEIADGIEGDPQGERDPAASEEAQRPIFPLITVGKNVTDILPFDGGGFREKKWNWSIREGEGMFVYAYNWDSGALTTGTTVEVIFKHQGVWLRD